MDDKRIAVIKLSSLGDIVHTIPAVSALRSAFPRAVISWFVEPAGASLLENFSGIDHIIPVNLKRGSLTGRISGLGKTLKLYKGGFDMIFDFQGLVKSAVLARLLGKPTMGFSRLNLREQQARFFYRDTVPYFEEENHVILKNLHLLSAAGISTVEISYPMKPLEFSPETGTFMKENGLGHGNYVILNIGGGWESKLLSHEQNLDIFNKIHGSLKKVILWGSPLEKERALRLSRDSGALITPFFNFMDLIQFIRNADTLISADSLPLHLSDAAGTRSVGIFGPTSPLRNGSMNRESIAVTNEIGCSFCYRRSCGHRDCISGINTADIAAFVNRD
jgi:heptosyltransferase-1